MHTVLKIFLYSTFALIICSCKKYLDAKSNDKLSTIESLDDLQELIDNDNLNMGMDLNNSSTDEFYVSYTNWQGDVELHQKAYTWDSQVNDFDDWRDQYSTVFYANTVLDNLQKMPAKGQ